MAPPWTDPAWRSIVQRWAQARLAAAGRPVIGPWEQPHVQPWSTALRAPTTAGAVWLKANGPGTSYEPRLLGELAVLSPLVPRPLAVDAERAWSLTAHAGERLRDRVAAEPLRSGWEQVLTAYAELQRAAAPRAGRLVALGVPDLRPAVLPGLLAQTLADDAVTSGLAPGELRRLADLEQAYGRWCRELDAGGVAPSVQHDDLHDGNVLVDEDRVHVIDWGDAALAHPFSTLLVTLRSVAHRWALQPDDPALTRLRDAYLEPWTAEHPPDHLRRLVTLAVAVAPLGRALAWRRALVGADDEAAVRWWPSVPGWMEELGAAPAPL